MAVLTQLHHIARCDVCQMHFDELGDYWAWDETPELALAQIEADPDSDWTLLPDSTVVCPRSDAEHDTARGAESPAELRPGPDAMTACFT